MIYRLLFVCFLFVWLRISPPRIKLAASNFAQRFIGVQGMECPILGNFAPPEAQNLMNHPGVSHAMAWAMRVCARPRIGSACVERIYGRP